MVQDRSGGEALPGPGAQAGAGQQMPGPSSSYGADDLKLANAMVDITLGTVVQDAAVMFKGDPVAMFAMLCSGLYGAATNSPAAMAASYSAAMIMLHESGRIVDIDTAVNYVHEHAKEHGLPKPPTSRGPEQGG